MPELTLKHCSVREWRTVDSFLYALIRE